MPGGEFAVAGKRVTDTVTRVMRTLTRRSGQGREGTVTGKEGAVRENDWLCQPTEGVVTETGRPVTKREGTVTGSQRTVQGQRFPVTGIGARCIPVAALGFALAPCLNGSRGARSLPARHANTAHLEVGRLNGPEGGDDARQVWGHELRAGKVADRPATDTHVVVMGGDVRIEPNAVVARAEGRAMTPTIARITVTMFRLIEGAWRRSDVTIRERCYSPDEISSALALAGFGELLCYDAGDLGMAGQLGEGRTFFVATKWD